ncbi:MAG: hypothetical protein ACYCX2_10310 [Christensenellales bacterium]
MPFAQAILTAELLLCVFHSADTLIGKLRFRRRYVLWALLLHLFGTVFSAVEFSNELWISPGGFIVPFLISLILWIGAKEKFWSFAALVCNAIGLYLFSKFIFLPGTSIFAYRFYFLGALCGIGALLLGRYRNTVFITALLSMQLFGLLTALEDWILGGYAMLRIGTQDELNACTIALAISFAGIFLRVKRMEKRNRLAQEKDVNSGALLEGGQSPTQPAG